MENFTLEKFIAIDEIDVGYKVPEDLFSYKGELVLTKGLVINEALLGRLKRRLDKYLYVKRDKIETEDEENKKSEIDIRKKSIEEGHFVLQLFSVAYPEITNLGKGEEGFTKLMNLKEVKELEKTAKAIVADFKPIGYALKNKLNTETLKRDKEYITSVNVTYKNLINYVKKVYYDLIKGNKVNGIELQNVIKKLIDLYSKDRSMIVNLSNQKSDINEYLFQHVVNVTILSINIATSAGYSLNQIIEIGTAALLNDVGMLTVPVEIRLKEGKLTNEEWYEVKKHPIMSSILAEKVTKISDLVKIVVYQVHEREDGSGYPKQRKGALIHKFSKIVSIADIYDALTSPRNHRKKLLPFQAVKEILNMTKRKLLDKEVVKHFLNYASLFPIGTLVRLSDGRIAKVIDTNEDFYDRPIVRILMNNDNSITEDQEIIDLKTSKLSIVESLDNEEFKDIDIMKGFE